MKADSGPEGDGGRWRLDLLAGSWVWRLATAGMGLPCARGGFPNVTDLLRLAEVLRLSLPELVEADPPASTGEGHVRCRVRKHCPGVQTGMLR